MDAFLRDLRYAARSLRGTPGPAAVAGVALALGIGLTTTVFSIVYGALMTGLPYPDGDRVAVVSLANPSRDITRSSPSIQDFVDYRAAQRSFTAVGGYTQGTVNVSGSGAGDGATAAERFNGAWVTADLFTVLGVPPLLGRTFTPAEAAPGGDQVVVLSYALWQHRYGGDRDILGRQIRVNGAPYTVIGVMPQRFDFPDRIAIWLPVQDNPLATKRGEGLHLATVGRLRPGVGLDQASLDLATTARRLAAAYPQADSGYTASVMTYPDWALGRQPRQLLYTMLGAVFLVLLIACANVANLLLSRAAHRTKEVGVRVALGASRAQVIRQFLAESTMLALAGAAFGIVIAWVGIHVFNRAIVDSNPPSFIRIGLFPPVLLFAAGAGVVASLAAGIFPAVQSARTDVNEVLKDESRGSSSLHIGRLSKGLVIVEIAFSCALLVAAGLMVKSVTRLRTMDPGFATKTVFTARVGYPLVYTDTARQQRFFRQLAERVALLPGVQAATTSSGLPGAQQGLGRDRFALEGRTYARPQDQPETRTLSVTPGFFETLDIRLSRGRLLSDQDRETTPAVAVVTQRFVDRFFQSQDPLGRRIRLSPADSTQPWLSIVGVVPNVFGGDPQDPLPPVVIRPLAQAHSNFVYLSARTQAAPMTLTQQVRTVAAQLEPDLPLYWIMSLDQAIAQPLWFVRVFGTMFVIFGGIALFLAAVGLYAVMSFSVSRRTREIGIRMALGAEAVRVVRMIIRQGAVQLAVGMVIGLAAALGVSSFMSVILFDVQPHDAMVFGGVAATLALAGLLASTVPAFRATRVDPLTALRTE
jgi:putative ABC transport system permease protein